MNTEYSVGCIVNSLVDVRSYPYEERLVAAHYPGTNKCLVKREVVLSGDTLIRAALALKRYTNRI